MHPKNVDVSAITDIVLTAVDFMNGEVDKLDSGETPDGSSEDMRQHTHDFLRQFKIDNGDDPDVDLRKAKPQQKAAAGSASAAPAPPPAEKPQQYFIPAAKPAPQAASDLHVYAATLHFEQDCGMEEVRANPRRPAGRRYDQGCRLPHLVPDRHGGGRGESVPRRDDFPRQIGIQGAREHGGVRILADAAAAGRHRGIGSLGARRAAAPPPPEKKPRPAPPKAHAASQEHESQMISVRVDKLDRLMDLVGELVIAESMVTQNPDLAGLELANFSKAARQLHKLNEELQDGVMALRMVPISGTFKKMNRIVRDMTKNLGKKARLVLVGEDTEVDKNIAEHIGDPLWITASNCRTSARQPASPSRA